MVVPTSAAMSMPRCPLPYGVSGGSNAWMTGPTTGHVQPPVGGVAAEPLPVDDRQHQEGQSHDDPRTSTHRSATLSARVGELTVTEVTARRRLGFSPPQRADRGGRRRPWCGSGTRVTP